MNCASQKNGDFNQPNDLSPGELIWPIAEHQKPEVVNTVEDFFEAMLFCPQVDRVVVLPNGIELLGQEGAMPDLLTQAVAKSRTTRSCLDVLDKEAHGRFRGRLWHYAKRGEEEEIKREEGKEKSLDAAYASYRKQQLEGNLPEDVPVYVSELRWMTKVPHPIEKDKFVATATSIDIFDATPLARKMPLWERSEGGIFIGERGTGSGLHVDQCLWSNVGRNWCGFKLFAVWPWEERKAIVNEMGKGHVFNLPLTRAEEAALARAKTIALVKPGDVWTFSGAQPHTALVVGNGLNLSAYESYVPAHPDAVATLVSSNTEEAQIKDCWMADEDLAELYEDVVDNLQRALNGIDPGGRPEISFQNPRLSARLRECAHAMRVQGDSWCRELWRQEDAGERHHRREKMKELASAEDAADWAADDAAGKQRALIDRYMNAHGGANGAVSVLVASAAEPLTAPVVWAAPDTTVPSLYEAMYPLRAQCPRRRVVVESLLTADEARYFTHDLLDEFGDTLEEALARQDEDGEGEASLAYPDWGPHPLNERLCSLVCAQVRLHFDESRPLFLAGALLIRMTSSRALWPAHVDKANIGYYDYSAVVYLNTQGTDFEGGSFRFLDEDGEALVGPRAGRCVIFASGTENLHQVQPVTSGQRFAIGLWLTLTPECGTGVFLSTR